MADPLVRGTDLSLAQSQQDGGECTFFLVSFRYLTREYVSQERVGAVLCRLRNCFISHQLSLTVTFGDCP